MIPALLTDSVTTDLERAVNYVLLWGLEAVELRSVGGPMDRVPHVNEQKVRRRLLDSELPAVAIAPGLFEGDVADRAEWLNELALLDDSLQFCTRLGCSRIVVSGFRGDPTDEAINDAADALRRAGVRAAKKDIDVCVLNAEGGMASTGAALARLLDVVNHDSIKAAWDPVAALKSGENPAKTIDALASNVGLVRCRNAEAVGNGWQPRAIDRGAVDWRHQLERLNVTGFEGPLSLEVTGEPTSKAGLHDATTLIGLIRSVRK